MLSTIDSLFWLLDGIMIILLIGAMCLMIVPLVVFATFLYLKFKYSWRRRRKGTDVFNVGFFHPYCNAGGGGERVLWTAVKAIQSEYNNVQIYVYTGDLNADRETIMRNVKKVFNIDLGENLQFLYLLRRSWVEAEAYSFLTMLRQSAGSVWLGLEALDLLQPDIYIDTMGYAFTYPLFKYIGGCKIASYTHYPTISTDMIRNVYRRVLAHNNRQFVARNPIITGAKILYYKAFAFAYGLAGRSADIIMVNSTWTEEHINAMWRCPLRTHRVYPPCDIERLRSLELLPDGEKGPQIRILSVGQFRPEKNHPLILHALYALRAIIDEEMWPKVKLVVVGSCRNQEDEVRVKDMQDLSKHLSIDDNVEFKTNLPYEDLVEEFRQATIGIHAMWNEHFGISVVDCMAAGLLMVAHASGGPKADIIETQVGSQTGFLAVDEIGYARVLAHLIYMSPEDRSVIRNAARASVDRFSNEKFISEFLRTTEPLFRAMDQND